MCWDHSFLDHITKIHMRFWQYPIQTWIHDKKVNISLLMSFVVTRMKVNGVSMNLLRLKTYLNFAACYQLKLSRTSVVYAEVWYKSVSSSNSISLSGYPTVLWIIHDSSICNESTIRLKEWGQRLHCPNYVLTKVSPHKFSSKPNTKVIAKFPPLNVLWLTLKLVHSF